MAQGNVVRLREIDGIIYASSRHVAEDFGKQHFIVLRDIEALAKEMPTNVYASWFRDDSYFDAYNRKQPCIDMTRQGWELVVMNYRGLIPWKVAYILKFEEMESRLGPGARTAGLFDRTNPAFQGLPLAQGEFALTEAPTPHPSRWSPAYAAWRNRTIEQQLPRPAADDEDEDDSHARAAQWRDPVQVLTRDELPITNSPEAWKKWAREQWFRIPLHLRQHWWRDTNYGERLPSKEVIDAIYHHYSLP
jgi:Rha family phage regulatory protein